MQFGICNEIFKGWTLPDAFAFAARAGYDLVEIAPFTIAKSVTEITAAKRAEIRDQAARAGIAIAGLHWVLLETENLSLNSPDSETRDNSAIYFTELVDCCADLGGTRVIVGSPKQRQVASGMSQEQAWELATETLREAVKFAEDLGVVICIEPLAANETNFINTAAEGVRFAGQFGSPAMSVVLDVKAMCAEEKPVPQIIRECAGRFSHFHANDRNLKGPGFGDVDFTPIATALRDANYDGTISVEVFDFDEGPEVIATRSRDYLRRIFK